MAWTSSLPSSRWAWLGPLVGLLNAAAACMLMGVLALGVLYARLFGAAVTKEREPEPESNGSAAHSNSAQLKDKWANAPVFIDNGARTPVQRRYPSSQGWLPDDDFAENVRLTPPGQMLCSGVGPTPATPAPAHPGVQTVPARRTSAPPSPTVILPRNLESVLLAAANAQPSDDSPGCTASCGATDATDAAEADISATATSVAFPTPPVSIPPPPPPSDPACCRADALEPVSAAPSSPPEVANGKADPTCPPDAVKTVPRRAPSATAPAPAVRLLTAPFEAEAAAAEAAGCGDVDSGSGSPTHSASSAIAQGSSNGRKAFVAAAAGALSADSPTSSWPARHQINILFREANDSTEPNSPDGAAGRMAAAPGAKAVQGLLRSSGGLQQHPTDQLQLQEEEEEEEKPAGSRALRTGMVAVPVAELLATPRSPGPEGATPAGAEAAGGVPSAPGRTLLKLGAVGSSGGVTNGAVEPFSPLAVAETPIAFRQAQQRQLPGCSPVGTPVASPAPQKRATAAGGVLPAANGTQQLKGRAPPGPKGQQQQARASGAAASSSKGNVAVTVTPLSVVSGSQQKRSVVSPTAASAAATPATSRRPVGPEAATRSLRPGAGKKPVARKLNPASPRPDAAPEASTRVAAAGGQECGSASVRLRSVCSEASAATAAGGASFLPRYAAPTAASIARKTQLAVTPQRSSASQRLLLAVGTSVGGAETDGVGVGGEEGGGGAPGAGGRRVVVQEGRLRATVSATVSGSVFAL